ncbi:hypothetical protein EVA_05839, partial [gut metagenome]
RRIKMATGWERGADGKWRYEVMDGEFDRKGELHPERRKLSAEEKKELDDSFDEIMDAFEKGSQAYKGEIDENTDMADIYEAGGMERKKAERLSHLEDKETELSLRPKCLDDYISNEELFSAYPELRNVKVEEGDALAAFVGRLGHYNPKTNTILLNDMSRDVLLHETQHIIQYLEGFAKGGSPNAIREVHNSNNHIRRIINALLRNLGIDEWLISIDDDILEQLEEKYCLPGRDFNDGYMFASSMNEIDGDLLRKKLDEANRIISNNNEIIGGEHRALFPEQHYKRLAGEVEARNVENRMDMPEEERRKTLAAETEDVAREDQIFIMENVGNNALLSMNEEEFPHESKLNPKQEISVIQISSNHGFESFAKAKEWAKEHIVRTYTNEETGNKGEIRISNTAINKFLSKSSVEKSENKDVYLSVLRVLPNVIRESVNAEQHVDYKKGEDGVRSSHNGINQDVIIHRLYGAVSINGDIHRVKVTLKENIKTKETTKTYNYEAIKIELLAGQHGDVSMTSPRNSNNSITLAKLLKGVEKSYSNGELLLDDGVEDENLRGGGGPF